MISVCTNCATAFEGRELARCPKCWSPCEARGLVEEEQDPTPREPEKKDPEKEK